MGFVQVRQRKVQLFYTITAVEILPTIAKPTLAAGCIFVSMDFSLFSRHLAIQIFFCRVSFLLLLSQCFPK